MEFNLGRSFSRTPDYDDRILASSVGKTHIPVVCRPSIHDSYNGEFLFKRPNLSVHREVPYNSSNMLERLISAGGNHLYQIIASKTTKIPLFIQKGFIQTPEGKILLMLTRDKNSINTMSAGVDKDYVLYLASELLSDPQYGAFYRRLQQIYLHHFFEKGIEVHIVPSQQMEINTFSNDFKLQYNAVSELDGYLRSEVGGLLRRDNRYFERHGASLNIPPLSATALRNLRWHVESLGQTRIPTREQIEAHEAYLRSLPPTVEFIDDMAEEVTVTRTDFADRDRLDRVDAILQSTLESMEEDLPF